MASKRRLRRKACEGKVAHPTLDAAEAAARRLRLVAYRCAHCSGHHVGHPPGKVRQGLAASRRVDRFEGRMPVPD